MPTREDYTGALAALVRLQHVFKMTTDEMYHGLYLGFQGPSLQPDDVYEIGRQAFMEGYLDVSNMAGKLNNSKFLHSTNFSHILDQSQKLNRCTNFNQNWTIFEK